MLASSRISLPWWLTVIIILESLPLFLGPFGAIANPEFIQGTGAEGLNQATLLYAARNLAVGFAFIIAFALRNAPMLFILILIRLITDAIDLPTFLAFDAIANTGRVTAIFIFLYYIPAVIALRYLWKVMREDARV